MKALFSIAFLPPVDYLLALSRCEVAALEACEHYQKQSYRNRCEIVTSQGIQTLTLPIRHTHTGQPIPIREAEIEYRTPWQGKLLRAIRSAYATAPYFIHYYDELAALVSIREPSLWAYNLQLLGFLTRHLHLAPPSVVETTSYETTLAPEWEDLRASFHPKQSRTVQLRYYQVFADRLPFFPNVSGLDLLFNEGALASQMFSRG